MITFFQCELSSVPEPVRERTVVAYEGWYGGFRGETSHTPLLQIGIIPLSLLEKKGWIWFQLLQRPTWPMLRAGRRAVQDFWRLCDWQVVASVETAEAFRFAEFCHLRSIGEVEGLKLLEKSQ